MDCYDKHNRIVVKFESLFDCHLASVRRWAAYFDYLSENIESAKGRGNDD